MPGGSRSQRALRWTLSGLVIGAGVGVGAFFVLRETVPRYSASILHEVRTDDVARGVGGHLSKDEAETFAHKWAYRATSNTTLRDVLDQPEIERETAWGANRGSPLSRDQDVLALRGTIATRVLPGPILELEVTTGVESDAPIVVEVLDEVVRNKELTETYRSAQSSIQDAERKLRDRRQDVAALDIRAANLVHEKRIIGESVELSTAFIEREMVLERLVGLRETLAKLPVDGADPTSDAPDRSALERAQGFLEARLAMLESALSEQTRVLMELENLHVERASKMEQVEHLDRRIVELSLTMEQGGRLRSLSGAAPTPERIFPRPLPTIAAGAAIFGVLGFLGGAARPERRTRTETRRAAHGCPPGDSNSTGGALSGADAG